MKKRTLLSWSSGKDSAWSLHLLRQDPEVEILGLFTVMNGEADRASMHATRRAMLERQARAAGLPLETIPLPFPCTMEQCNAIMGRFVRGAVERGIACMAFGDLFLEDIRRYRVDQLAGSGIEPLFPVWGLPTAELARAMLAAGVQATVSSVDLTRLPAETAGKPWDAALLDSLPAGCDPCGENGEIHTIVTDGPMFGAPIPFTVGETLQRDGFAYADVIPADAS